MDHDDTQKALQLIVLQPIETFYHALTGVQSECVQIDIATRHQDQEDVQIAAEDAVSSYLRAKAAAQRLELCAKDAPEVMRTIDLALSTARQMLDGVLERASEQTTTTSLHWLLQQLRRSLAVASGEPPPNGSR